jgi:hypothetical protein
VTTILRPWTSLLALVLLMNGCLAPATFSCGSDAQCVKEGAQGKCMSDACAFLDPSCVRGYRWDTTAPVEAGKCVCTITLSADSGNCGGCGKTCPNTVQVLSTTCQQSACKIKLCFEDYADCDGRYDNGCECHGLCAGSTCAPPTCSDRLKNGDETDVDCGGYDCPSCQIGQDCNSSYDCASNWCNFSDKCASICETCGFRRCCGTACSSGSSPGVYCSADHDCQSCHCDKTYPQYPKCS